MLTTALTDALPTLTTLRVTGCPRVSLDAIETAFRLTGPRLEMLAVDADADVKCDIDRVYSMLAYTKAIHVSSPSALCTAMLDYLAWHGHTVALPLPVKSPYASAVHAGICDTLAVQRDRAEAYAKLVAAGEPRASCEYTDALRSARQAIDVAMETASIAADGTDPVLCRLRDEADAHAARAQARVDRLFAEARRKNT